MQIGAITLSYPHIRFPVSVTHFTPRKSTVIEWVLLEIISKFGNNRDYAGIGLDKLFSIIQLPDADKLVKPCMIKLQDIGALASDTLSDDTSLSEMSLRDVSLTQSGADMQKRGLLPGTDRTDGVDITFNAYDNSVEAGVGKYVQNQRGIAVKQIDETNIVFPGPLVLEWLNKQKTAKLYQWLQSTTEIKNLETTEGKQPKILWKNNERKISVQKDGTITIDDFDAEAPEQRLLFSDEFIRSLQLEMPYEASKQSLDGFFDDTKEIFFAGNLAKKIQMATEKARLIFCKKIPENIEGKSKRLIVIYGGDGFACVINGKQMSITLSEAMPVPNAICITDTGNIFAAITPLHNGSLSTEFTIGYCKKQSPLDSTGEIERIIRGHGRRDIRILATATFSSIPNMVVEKMLNECLEGLPGLREKAKVISEAVDTFAIFDRNVDFSATIQKLFVDDVLGNKTFANKAEIEKAIAEIQNIALVMSKQRIKNYLLESVLRRVRPLSDIHIIWDIFSCLDLASNTEVKIPVDTIYTEKTFTTMFAHINDAKQPCTKAWTIVEKVFIDFYDVFARVKELLPEIDYTIKSGAEFIAKIVYRHKESIERLHGLTAKWDDLKKKMPFNQLANEVKAMQILDEIISEINKAVAVFYDDISIRYERIFVVDTNTLMNNPAILENVSAKEAMIIPNVVNEELDGLKQSDDKDKAYKAREAIRIINDRMTATQNIKMTAPQSALLPEGLDKKKADNLVLSVALKYIVKKPVLITDDINLQNAAASCKVTAVKLSDYLDSKKQKEAPKTSQAQSNQKGKKK